MDKFVFVILAFLGCLSDMYAVPAYPRKVVMKLTDGTEVKITLQGDEYNKWALTEDNYTLLPFGEDWVFAQASSEGKAVCSGYSLCADERRSADLKAFLARQPRKMVPERKQASVIRRSRSLHAETKRPVVGQRKALVILMSFSDLGFVKSNADFDALFNRSGYGEDGAQGSVYDYFLEVSYGQLFLKSDVIGPFSASYPMAYYGRNGLGGADTNPYALFEEAVEFAAREVNLRDYDADGDGYVDNIHIVFAGYGEEAGAQSQAIWSHESSFQPISVQGMLIDRYSCTPELRGNRGMGISRIGPCCHEMGHALGAMDYYDTDYTSGGSFEGTGEWDIMASGSWNNEGITPPHFNPYVKVYDFGWLDAKILTGEGTCMLSPSTLYNNEIYRIDTPSEGDYYLLENRVRAGFDTALPGEGLMVFHVHPDMNRKLQDNSVNVTAPQCLYPVCASSSVAYPSSSSQSYGDVNSAGCPFPGTSRKTSFGVRTVPAAFCWDGSEPDFELTEIIRRSDGQVSFSYTCEGGEMPPAGQSVLLFDESFETEANALSWNVPDEYGGDAGWLRTKVSNGGNGVASIATWNTFSSAADGEYYMAMEKMTFSGMATAVMLSPNEMDVSDGECKLTFYYQCRSRFGNKPILEVYAKFVADGSLEKLLTVDEVSSEWKKVEITLPQSDTLMQIVFKGILEGTCGVYVDAVSVTTYRDVTAVECVAEQEKQPLCTMEGEGCLRMVLPASCHVSVCSMDGLSRCDRRYEKGTYMLSLPSGLYVIRIGDWTKKVWVR